MPSEPFIAAVTVKWIKKSLPDNNHVIAQSLPHRHCHNAVLPIWELGQPRNATRSEDVTRMFEQLI